jgi:murein DD-endopeptidase MepM/ murein hydrolase activator NlpD
MPKFRRPSRAHALLAVLAAAIAFAAACAPPPPPPPPPPGAPNPLTFGCPVAGSTYTSTFGPRTGGGIHYGTDMFAPTGRPEKAVGPGRVTYQVETAGGNTAYLWADDGNVYYYAHMSSFVGANDRRVVKGDTIGLLGQTGNATAPHLHFEIRLGGANGTRIDPYPTLVAAHC